MKRLVLEEEAVDASVTFVRSILNNEMCLKFQKIKKIPNKANSVRNRYMRQQFGMKMLDLLASNKRILNIDETWIGQTNFARQSW